MQIASKKEAFRKRFRNYREALSQEEYERLSRTIIDEVELLHEIRVAETIHVYWPMVAQREVDTRPLIRRLEAKNKTVVLPLVVDFDHTSRSAGRLTHVRFPGESELRANRWGIYEPPRGEAVEADVLDAVIVPSLGAGRDGHRIGHGYGFYDEFLAAVDCPTIGLVYDACLVDALPHEAHDVRLNVVVSEADLLRVP